MVHIYLGCDLFTEGQRWQALTIQKALEDRFGKDITLYNPADNLDINDKSAGFASGSMILMADYERLKQSDILIALMDTQDLGLAAEMGIAFERGIDIYQLYTDIRLGGADKQDKIEAMQADIFQNDFLYINKLVTGLSYINKGGVLYDKPRIYQQTQELINALIEDIEQKIETSK